MSRRLFAAILVALFPAVAQAQTVKQSGAITPGHVAGWLTTGVIGDGGAASAGNIKELGITNTGLPSCVRSSPTSVYNLLCIGADTTIDGTRGGFITYNAYGGATARDLTFNVNGQNYTYPGTGSGNIVGPNSSTIGVIPVFNNTVGTLLANSAVQLYTAAIPATATGTANLIVLAPSYLGSTTIQNGMAFRFNAPFSSTTASFVTVNVTGMTGGPWNVFMPDGYTNAFASDVQLGNPMEIVYSTARSAFVIRTPSPVTTGYITSSANGNVSLAAVCAGACQTIVLNPGQGPGAVLQWNTTAGGYRLVRIPIQGGPSANLFDGTANIEGAIGPASNNTLYGVYLEPSSTSNTFLTAPPLSFWRTSVAGTPVADFNGISIKSGDPTRVFLGLVYTRVGDIGNYIASANSMGNAVYSHYFIGRTRLGYQTTQVSNAASSTSFATQGFPFIGTTTEGGNDSPTITASSQVTCDTNGAVASQQFQFGGVAYNGAPVGGVGITRSITLPTAGNIGNLVSVWESGPPYSYLTFQLNIKASVGTCTFVSDMLASLPQ